MVYQVVVGGKFTGTDSLDKMAGSYSTHLFAD